jgi:hypothetical protein
MCAPPKRRWRWTLNEEAQSDLRPWVASDGLTSRIPISALAFREHPSPALLDRIGDTPVVEKPAVRVSTIVLELLAVFGRGACCPSGLVEFRQLVVIL